MDKLQSTLVAILGSVLLTLMSWTTYTTHKLSVNQAVLIERTKHLGQSFKATAPTVSLECELAQSSDYELD